MSLDTKDFHRILDDAAEEFPAVLSGNVNLESENMRLVRTFLHAAQDKGLIASYEVIPRARVVEFQVYAVGRRELRPANESLTGNVHKVGAADYRFMVYKEGSTSPNAIFLEVPRALDQAVWGQNSRQRLGGISEDADSETMNGFFNRAAWFVVAARYAIEHPAPAIPAQG